MKEVLAALGAAIIGFVLVLALGVTYEAVVFVLCGRG